MRYYKYLVVFLALLLCTNLFADITAGLGDADIDDGSVTYETIEAPTQGADGTSPDANSGGLSGTAYVGVYTFLNIRNKPWGDVIGQLHNNDAVNIVGQDNSWYIIDSPMAGYVYFSYVFPGKDQRYPRNAGANEGSTSGSNGVILDVSGDSEQARVCSAAGQLVQKYSVSGSFPYAAGTNNGSLGCANVVTKALHEAGVNIGIDLSCVSTKSKLINNCGYKEVTASVPPYQAGDIIFWSTYDRDNDGKKDKDTHIGIICPNPNPGGNSVQAMSNSSSQKKPRYHDPNYAPVTTVLRKA